ncbi:hypothetical protein CLOM_g17901 [Closterium sp. NIES-68]|nr:hypothetical protein CLOM_g17901 [Closterium sp. NIES-68]
MSASCSRRKAAVAAGGPRWLPRTRRPSARKGMPGGRTGLGGSKADHAAHFEGLCTRPKGRRASVRCVNADAHAAGSPRSVISSAYARQSTVGNADAVAWSAGCKAAAKSRGPIGSPWRTPRALRRGSLPNPAGRKWDCACDVMVRRPTFATRRCRHSPMAIGRVPPPGLGKAMRRLAPAPARGTVLDPQLLAVMRAVSASIDSAAAVDIVGGAVSALQLLEGYVTALLEEAGADQLA